MNRDSQPATVRTPMIVIQMELSAAVEKGAVLGTDLERTRTMLQLESEEGNSQLQSVGQELAIKAREVLAFQHELDLKDLQEREQRAETGDLTEQLASLQAKFTATAEKAAADKESLLSSLSDLKEEMEEASARASDELEQLAQSTAEEADRLTAMIEEETTAVATAQGEVHKLTQSMGRLQGENEALNSKLEREHEQNESLHQKLEEANEANHKLKVSSSVVQCSLQPALMAMA